MFYLPFNRTEIMINLSKNDGPNDCEIKAVCGDTIACEKNILSGTEKSANEA